MSKLPEPTDEQQAILSALREPKSLLVRALAGTGKSTTLEMIAHALPKNIALAIAFTKPVVEALRKRFPDNFQIATMNSLGHQAIGRALGKPLTLDSRKVGKIVTALAKTARLKLLDDDWDEVRKLVEKSRGALVVPRDFGQKVKPEARNSAVIADRKTFEKLSDRAELPPELSGLAEDALSECIKQSFRGTIDYDDQIYFSTLFCGTYAKFRTILVDESQDLSLGNHLQIAQSLDERSKLIVVGDELQSIYAFRGADAESMRKLRELRSEWIELPLATTFRCPKAVVESVRGHAKDYRAHERNPDGTIVTLPRDESRWKWNEVEVLARGRPIAVLCRNNAPLLSLAFKLLRRGISAQVLGRDIGKGLTALIKKLSGKNTEMKLEEFWPLLNAWEEKEVELARLNDAEEKIERISDQAESLRALAESGKKTTKELAEQIARIFEEGNARVTLSTIHKAKGLEWDVVVHLDPWRLPSKFALKSGGAALQQERNLEYVASTRTKDILVRASLGELE